MTVDPIPTIRADTGGSGDAEGDVSGPGYRYGIVFLLVLALVVFTVAAPDAQWSRAVALLMATAALIVSVTTARATESTRRRGIAVVVVASAGVVLGIATGYSRGALTLGYGALITAAVPPVLVRGLFRLLRDRGVTLQAVAGALVIYLSMGLVFAWVISLIVQISSTPYFAQHASSTLGDRVYFSFSTLTTTGFGDFSPATPVGHALAVVEMLIGQLYLVTVIGLLIGNYVGRSGSTQT